MTRGSTLRRLAPGVVLAVAVGACTSVPAPTAGPTLDLRSAAPSALISPPTGSIATVAPETPVVPTDSPEPTPNTNPAIIAFDTPKQEDCTNATAGSIHVSWTIAHATGVTISIDGPGIYDAYSGTSGSIDLPYGCDHTVLRHTYTLKTTGGSGPWVRVTHTVRTRAPSVIGFGFSPAAGCLDTTGSATLRMSYTVRAGTGAELYADGALYGSYSGTQQGPIPVAYDCSRASITFKLVTTGGYGAEASARIVVERPVEP